MEERAELKLVAPDEPKQEVSVQDVRELQEQMDRLQRSMDRLYTRLTFVRRRRFET